LFLKSLSIGILTVLASSSAFSAVVTYSDRSSFNAQGTIAYNSNFNEYAATDFTFPGNPYTLGDVRYTSEENLIVGLSQYSIGSTTAVMADNYWSPLTGDILNNHNLFGFDTAVTAGPLDVTLTTNLGSYLFSGLTVSDGISGFTFLGYKTTGVGEYFTSFRIDTLGSGYLVGVTNVAVGDVGGVPEPATMALMGASLAGLAFFRRKAAR
jgi:hypothetical protein